MLIEVLFNMVSMPIIGARMLYLVVSCYNDLYSIVITLIRVAAKNSVKKLLPRVIEMSDDAGNNRLHDI